MKTIRQIANEIGVSKQAVSKRLSQLPPTEVTTNEHRIKLISPKGELILKGLISPTKMFTANQLPPTVNQLPPTKPPTVNQLSPTPENELYKMLKDELDIKNKQLSEKDKQITEKDKQIKAKDMQIEDLTATIRTQAESINADRKNELAETLIDGQRKLIDSEVTAKKWWEFWK